MRVKHRAVVAAVAAAAIVPSGATAMAPGAVAQPSSYIGQFTTASTVASTVGTNGDVNPYGTAVVPRSGGGLHRGDVLVTNFNAVKTGQGTGTTIEEISPLGIVHEFAAIDPGLLPGRCPGGVGLTAALVVLRSGWVIAGSLPTTDGTAATAGPGCLLVLDSRGNVRETIAGHGIDGPWGMTAVDGGSVVELFVTNVLNGLLEPHVRGRAHHHVDEPGHVLRRGTVIRLLLTIGRYGMPRLQQVTRIGAGFAERTDPAALVIGPTGVGLGADGTLYVADTLRNRITAIPYAPYRTDSAGTGQVVSVGGALNGPLGLTIAPNGDILTVNGGDGNLVETTPLGTQVATAVLDSSGIPPGSGALFGLAVAPHLGGIYYVDDTTNTLDLLH